MLGDGTGFFQVMRTRKGLEVSVENKTFIFELADEAEERVGAAIRHHCTAYSGAKPWTLLLASVCRMHWGYAM